MSCSGFHGEDKRLSLKQKIAWIIVALIIILIAIALPSEGAVLKDGYVIVESGDSLSSIAKVVYDDYKKWPKLQELNSLDGTNIHVGQKIFYTVNLKHADKMKVASEAAFLYMKDYFKRRYGERKYTLKDKSYSWVMAPIAGQKSPQIHYNLGEVRRRAEWVDLVEVKGAVAKIVRDPEHVLLMTAFAEQESGYRNLDGTHTEKGPFQIKPTTALWHLRNELPSDADAYIESWLEDIENNAYTSYQILLGLGLGEKPLREVIESYNGGSKKKEYAEQVLKRYNKLLEVYHETCLHKMRKGVASR